MIGGKPATIIGDKHSNLILQGSSVKIQWGNKFIDVIKNGKIASENSKFIYQVQSEDEIEKDGLYLVNGSEIWISINSTKYKINSESSYISYLSNQELKQQQKQTALKNIGFYYDNLTSAQEAGIESGIIFVKETNKLYLVNNGIITEYSLGTVNSVENILENLYIEGNSLKVDTIDYIVCENKEITMNQNVVVNQSIRSHNAIGNQGFKLYNQDGNSYLDIDFINERYGEKNKFDKIAYTQCNTITSCESINDNNLKLTLLYDNKFAAGDTVFLISKNSFETVTSGDHISEIKFKFPLNTDLKLSYVTKNNVNKNITINSNSDTYSFEPLAKSIDIQFDYEPFQFEVIKVFNNTIEVPFDENIALNKYVYIAKSNSKPIPYIYNNNNSFEIYDDTHKLNTIIGYNSHLSSTGLFSSNTVFTSREEYNTEYQTEYDKTSGEYSNAFWASIFKFPTYSVKLAQELKDVINFKNSGESNKNDFIQTQMGNVSEGSIVPTIDIVKNIINNITPNIINNIIPKGTIVMWSGKSIPNGWIICNGENGTPNLVDKFVLGSTTDAVGSPSDENKDKYKYISSSSIPTTKNGDHNHTVNELTTDKAGSHSHMINFDTTSSIPYYKLIYIMKNV